MEDAIRHGQDVIHSLLKTVGGVRSDHHSLQKKLEENAEKRKAQIELNLKNRAQRVVESTHEHSLIKKLETCKRASQIHLMINASLQISNTKFKPLQLTLKTISKTVIPTISS